MLKTVEIRWFWPCSDIHAARSWFAGDYRKSSIETRTDSYLMLPGCEKTGVKLREGHFEIKAQAEGEKRRSWQTGQSGVLQQWVKWSFTDDHFPFPTEKVMTEENWLAVHKERLQRVFVVHSGRPMECVSESPDTDNQCNIELTKVISESCMRPFVTLGFEIKGQGSDAEKHLQMVADQFFRCQGGPPGGVLSVGNSVSYPAWLNTK